MFKTLETWYYKRLFFKIYLRSLDGPDPQNAIDDAWEDVNTIKKIKKMIHDI